MSWEQGLLHVQLGLLSVDSPTRPGLVLLLFDRSTPASPRLYLCLFILVCVSPIPVFTHDFDHPGCDGVEPVTATGIK